MAEDYTRDVTIKVTETGAAAATAALNKTTQAADKLQAETKTLGTRLVESKEQFSAVGGAAFAATSALQSTSGGVTQLLSGLGAVTGALSAVPGPVGAVAAGMTALLGVGASLATVFDDTAAKAEEQAEAMAAAAKQVENYKAKVAELQGVLGAGFSLAAGTRTGGLQAELERAQVRRGQILTDLEAFKDLQRAALADVATSLDSAKAEATFDRYTGKIKDLEAEFERLGRVQRDAQREIEQVARAEQIRQSQGGGDPKSATITIQTKGRDKDREEEFKWLEEQFVWEEAQRAARQADLDEQDKRDQARWALERDRINERRDLWRAEAQERKDLAREEIRTMGDTIGIITAKGEAYSQTALAALVAGESVGEAIKRQLAAEAAAAALEAGWNTLKYGALALGALAMGNAPAAAAFGQAAALWAGVGVVAGGIAAASGGFSAGAGGGGLGTGTPSAAEGLRQPEREEARAPVTVNVYTGQALATRTQIVEAVAQAWVEGTRQRGSPIHGFMGGR